MSHIICISLLVKAKRSNPLHGVERQKNSIETMRSSPPEVLSGKDILKICSAFTRKHHAEV